MRVRYLAVALPAVALTIYLSGGCGGNTTNEENLTNKSAAPGEGKVYKSYGEAAREISEENKAKADAAKAASQKPKS
jgi:hypothetical protein